MVGRAAVFLFFVLSGFWIHRMWEERYQRSFHPYVTFLISRVWRLMPVMLLATMMAAAVRLVLLGAPVRSLWSDGVVHTMISHLFLVGYSNLSEPRLVTPAWSLDIEMQFYLAAPALAFALAKLRAAAFVALCAGLTLFDVTPAALHALGWFAVGMLASRYRLEPPRALVIASLIAMPAVPLCAALVNLPLLVDPTFNDLNRDLNMLLAIAGVPLALHTCFSRDDEAGRERGNLSYIVYLIHWPLLICAQWAQTVHWLAPVIAAAAIFPISICIWRGVDAPIQGARSRWVARRVQRQDAAAISHGKLPAIGLN